MKQSNQLTLDVTVPQDPTFSNFIVEDSNIWIIEAIKSIIVNGQATTDQSAEPEPTVFVYGEPGSGKTHLCHSLREYAIQNFVSVSALSASRLVEENLSVFSSILILDDGDLIIDNPNAELRLLHLIEESRQGLYSLIVFSRSNLYRLGDLRTRADNSLQFSLNALSDTMVGRLLKQRCGKIGLKISENVINYILNQLPRDGNSISRLLFRIDRLSLGMKAKEVTLSMIRELKSELGW